MHETPDELLELFILITKRINIEAKHRAFSDEGYFVQCVYNAEMDKARGDLEHMAYNIREAARIANRHAYDDNSVWFHKNFYYCPATGKRRLPYF